MGFDRKKHFRELNNERKQAQQLKRAFDSAAAIIARLSSIEGRLDADNENAGFTHSNASVSRQVRASIYERDGLKCLKCGAKDGLTIDHIVPRSKGGDNSKDNLQTLCEQCNNEKGNKNCASYIGTIPSIAPRGRNTIRPIKEGRDPYKIEPPKVIGKIDLPAERPKKKHRK